MNYMPPDPAQNGGVPPQVTVDDVVSKALQALYAAANNGASSRDPDAVVKFGQAGFFWAQAIEKLMPPKPDPAATIKAQADMVKTGAQQAHDLHQAQLQREHDATNLAVQQAKQDSLAVRGAADNPGPDGNRNAQ